MTPDELRKLSDAAGPSDRTKAAKRRAAMAEIPCRTEAGRRHVFLSGSNPERQRIARETVAAIENEAYEQALELCNRHPATLAEPDLREAWALVESRLPEPGESWRSVTLTIDPPNEVRGQTGYMVSVSHRLTPNEVGVTRTGHPRKIGKEYGWSGHGDTLPAALLSLAERLAEK